MKRVLDRFFKRNPPPSFGPKGKFCKKMALFRTLRETDSDEMITQTGVHDIGMSDKQLFVHGYIVSQN